MRSPKFKCLPILAACIVLIFCASSKVCAERRGKALRPTLLKTALSIAGLESEVVSLDRGDAFKKGVAIRGVEDVTLVLGFPKAGIKRGSPFLLSVDGDDALIELSDKGTLRIVGGDGEIITAGIFSFVECIVDAAINMAEEIDDCGADILCILEGVLDGVVSIVGCVEEFL